MKKMQDIAQEEAAGRKRMRRAEEPGKRGGNSRSKVEKGGRE
jgi:hypothetical protein